MEALRAGRPADALKHLAKARVAAADRIQAIEIASAAYLQQGRPWRALDLLTKACRPGASASVATSLNRALTHLILGDPTGALVAVRDGDHAMQNLSQAWAIRANALMALNRHQEAVAAARKALTLNPTDRDAMTSLASALLESDRNEEALLACDDGLRAHPKHAPLSATRALALAALGRFAEAVQATREPDAAIVLDNVLDSLIDAQAAGFGGDTLDKMLAALGGIAMPLDALRRDPVVLALAGRLIDNGHPSESIRLCDRLSSEGLAWRRTLAQALAATGDVSGAEAILEAQLRDRDAGVADPPGDDISIPELFGHNPRADAYTFRVEYLANRLIEGHWNTYERDAAEIIDNISRALNSGFHAPVNPYLALLLPIPPALHRRIAESHALVYQSRSTTALPNRPPQTTPCLHVGYLSADFRNHPTGHLIRRLFGLHDRNRFRITAYALHPGDESPYHQQIVADADRFVPLQNYGDHEAAEVIASDRVDVLIDLMGYSKGSRPGILAHEPAPLQISFLGMPATTGADYIDYLIADPVVLPKQHRMFYHEAPLLLPGCCQVCDSEPPVAPEVITRDDESLPETGFVYCSFNRERKLTPALLDSWGRILAAVPNSFLWLLRPRDDARTQRLIDELNQRGVEPRRLILAPSTLRSRHLRRLALADLFLDAFIYSAATTGADALLAGLPLLTLRGQTFQSRVASSLLLEAGLPELVTDTQAEYEALAIRLAGEPERLRRWREKLQASRESGDLLSTERFVRNLERGLQMVWARASDGLPPQATEVPRERSMP